MIPIELQFIWTIPNPKIRIKIGIALGLGRIFNLKCQQLLVVGSHTKSFVDSYSERSHIYLSLFSRKYTWTEKFKLTWNSPFFYSDWSTELYRKISGLNIIAKVKYSTRLISIIAWLTKLLLVFNSYDIP